MVESTCNIGVEQLVKELVDIHNGRTEIRKACKEIIQATSQAKDLPQDNLFTRTLVDAEAFLSKVIIYNLIRKYLVVQNQVLVQKKSVTINEVSEMKDTVLKVLEIAKQQFSNESKIESNQEENELTEVKFQYFTTKKIVRLHFRLFRVP